MPSPNPAATASPSDLAGYDAVNLFIERASAAKSGYVLTALNAPAVARICYRLDGIPLAIELAAARVKLFSADQIATRLDDRFRLLTGGSRTALPRQQTLQGTIDWSHGLLSAPERVIFRRLSVFTGGWTFEAAEQVLSGAEIETSEVLELLARLVEKSLVVEEDQGHESRYRMLETIRQYAVERLSEVGENALARERHLQYFLRFAQDAEPHLYEQDQARWLDRLSAERDNLRAALDHASTSGQVETGLRLASALREYWYLLGVFGEDLRQLERMLGLPQAASPTLDRARALNAAAALLITTVTDVERGERYAAEALAIAEAQTDEPASAQALYLMGFAMASRQDFPSAAQLLNRSVAISRRSGHKVLLSDALGNLACVCHVKGDYEQARTLFTECMALYREVGHQNKIAWTFRQTSYVALRLGDLPLARQLAMQSVQLNLKLNSHTGIVNCLAALAGQAAARGLPLVAVQLCAAVSAHVSAMQTYLYFLERYEFEKTLDQLHRQLDPAPYAAAWKAGGTLTLEQAVDLSQVGIDG